jgi:hypothetical protein
MRPYKFSNLGQPSGIAVHHPPSYSIELPNIFQRPIFVNVPAILGYPLQCLGVERYIDMNDVSHRLTNIRHLDEDFPSETSQLCNADVPVNLRELGEGVVDGVLVLELRAVGIESIGDEDRDVIHPRIPRGCAEEDPVVTSGELDEGLDPCTTSHETLFIEDKESARGVNVPLKVVPRIDDESTQYRVLRADSDMGKLLFPVMRIPFFRSCDDVNIARCFTTLVVLYCCEGLTGTDPAPEDLAVGKPLKSLLLMRTEFHGRRPHLLKVLGRFRNRVHS